MAGGRWHGGWFFWGKQTFHVQTQIEHLRAIPSTHVLLLSLLLRIHLHRYPNLVRLLFQPMLTFSALAQVSMCGWFLYPAVSSILRIQGRTLQPYPHRQPHKQPLFRPTNTKSKRLGVQGTFQSGLHHHYQSNPNAQHKRSSKHTEASMIS